MEVYQNKSGTSPIAEYEIGSDFIKIQFRGDGSYLYNYQIPGFTHVETMKKKARDGIGLASYIGRHVKSNFFRKF